MGVEPESGMPHSLSWLVMIIITQCVTLLVVQIGGYNMARISEHLHIINNCNT